MAAIGLMEAILILPFLLPGLGLPIGIPPLPADATIERATPENCLFYFGLAGLAEASESSANHLEAILANSEVREFMTQLDSQLLGLLRQAASKDPNLQPWTESGPGLARLALTRPSALFVERIDISPGRPPDDIAAGFIIHCGPNLADAKKWLGQIEATLLRDAPPGLLKEVTKGDDKFNQLDLPIGMPASWGFHGDYFMFTVGKKTLDDVLTRVETAKGPPTWLTGLKKKHNVPRPSAISYINVAQVLETAKPHFTEPKAMLALEVLGLGNLKTVSIVQGLDNEAMVQRCIVETDGSLSGIFDLISATPLQIDDLRGISKNVMMAGAARLDLAELVRRYVNIVAKLDANVAMNMQAGLASLKPMLGFDLEQDLLGSLGDVWIAQASLDGGLFGVTSISMTVSVRDQEKLRMAHDKLLEFAGRSQAGREESFSIRPIEISGLKAWQLLFNGPVPLSPTWCIANDRLIIGGSIEAVKEQLAQAKRKTGLVDQPDVAPRLKQGAAAFSYQDTRTSMRSLVAVAQSFSPMISGALRQQGFDFSLPPLPNLADIEEHLTPSVMTVRRGKNAIVVDHHQSLPTIAMNPGSSGVMIALLLPAVQAAREAARRTNSANNLRSIGIALQNYHDQHRRLPAATIRSKAGKPLLSWRVELLPYVGEEALYKQFHLDEPWDSEHNRALIDKIPSIYQNPSSNVATLGKTVYLAPIGKDTIFEGERGIRFADIADGLSRTIAIVETGDESAAYWTEPKDLDYDPDRPLAGVPGAHPGGFLVLFMDASVHFVPEGVNPAIFRASISRQGGEPQGIE